MASKKPPPAATAINMPQTPVRRLDDDYGDDKAKIRVEFSINATKQTELDKIDEVLRSRGCSLVESNLQDKTIQLELKRDSSGELSDIQTLQRFIEDKTGLLTVVKGLGKLSSAVAELQSKSVPMNSNADQNENVMGVMRISQLSGGYCFFDGILDGFNHTKESPKYSVAVHEYGDLSGPVFETIGSPITEIDRLESHKLGRVSIRRIVPECDVPSMIGRSIAVTKHTNESPPKNEIVSAGVVARASIIDGNKKQICSCSGKTLWDERVDKKQRERN